MDILDFVGKWTRSGAAEKANKDHFLVDLCDVLGVPRPDPATGDPERDAYIFEADAVTLHEGGKATIRKIDLFKRDAFILEAKQGSDEGSAKLGTARRGTPGWHSAMAAARGQAIGYARTLDDPPPFIITCDIGYCFDIHACFDGSADYRAFPNAASSRLFVKDLEGHVELLRTIWTAPRSLDPSRYSAKITREIAGHLADLAKTLEEQGHAQERVAKFLMRCLFTMFAEDVALLPERAFVKALEKEWLPDPKRFKPEVESLWRIMNEGGEAFTLGRILKFNGGLFKEPEALPLSKEQLKILHAAARCRWEDVEPAIFGTLLERALDPKERHALGAHYTPRAYVERLVKPTIEEPLRDDWDVVQAEVHQLVAQDKIGDAQRVVRAFHEKLCHIRVLDPACGTGNFLYVTLDLFKRIEGEVNELLHGLGSQESLQTTRLSVTPEQFLGIEVKPWAREIAELVLWIGYLQWEFRIRGKTSVPEEPILRDYGNIECRDAVLAWDSIEPVLDDDGKPVTRWDGETMKTHPATGEDVPDDSARVEVVRYVNPRRAEWPKADFVVGNPPYIGNKRMRLALGDGYVEALRAAHGDVAETVDLVMYWWDRAARLVRDGTIRRFGFITTNSITQTFNRNVVDRFVGEGGGISLAFAIPDHPWVDAADGAAVRVAMTVGTRGTATGSVLRLHSEGEGQDGAVGADFRAECGRINAVLSVGGSASLASSLRSNAGLAFTGMYPLGQGFVILPEDRVQAVGTDQRVATVVKPFVIARDLTQRPRHAEVIDFWPRTVDEARRDYPSLFQWVLQRVKPERDQNPVEERRRNWWLFTRPIPALRHALSSMSRYILIPRTAKHPTFQFASSGTVPDTSVVAIVTNDALLLGVLSSRIHVAWALDTGGTLEDRPRYQHGRTFNPFPFPAATDAQAARIRDLGESLDAHRKRQQALHSDLTITGMYNVLEKLRSGEPLTAKERVINEKGFVATLQKIHDDIDAAVFDAYGWPPDLTDEQILERLVALNAERAEEERRGLVRWLRPEYQAPREAPVVQGAFGDDEEGDEADTDAAPKKGKGKRKVAASADLEPQAWPATLAERIAAVRDLLTRSQRVWTTEDVAGAFKRARRSDVEAVLESLTALGLLLSYELPDGRRWRRPVRPAA